MQERRLTILGTASQVPTRHRNHIGVFLHWDKEGILFDPGEGTQRQLIFAGISASEITKICITHFHGDHCLGLPGIVQRLSLQKIAHTVEIYYPYSGQKYLHNLLNAAMFHNVANIKECPISNPGEICSNEDFTLETKPLDHGSDTWGYRLKERDKRTIFPHKLPPKLTGKSIGLLKEQGWIQLDDQIIYLKEISAPKPGQIFALVMDTRLCKEAKELAMGADILVCESTYLSSEERQARDYRHLTAAQAASIAQEAGAKKLILIHFSQRYTSPLTFLHEARLIHSDVIVGQDLQQIALPRLKRKLN